MNDFHKGDMPRKGDKVRVMYEAMYDDRPSYGGHMVSLGLDVDCNERWADVPAWATVEVLERADDPSKDLPGAIRRDPNHGTRVIRLEPKDPGFDKRYGFSITGTPWDCDEVDGWPVVDVVPGTPAAEAEKPARGLFQTVSDEHAAAIVSGDWSGMPQFEARKYPEVSGGGVPYPPVHVDNEAIVTGQYQARKGRGPRYFQGHSGTRQWKIHPDGVAFYRTTSDQEWALCHATIAVLSSSASVREVDSLDGEPS